MHTVTSAHLIPITGERAYIERMIGPISSEFVTPEEARAISEIRRCRRQHTDLIDWRRHSPTYRHDIYRRSSGVLRIIIRQSCAIIRRERARRG